MSELIVLDKPIDIGGEIYVSKWRLVKATMFPVPEAKWPEGHVKIEFDGYKNFDTILTGNRATSHTWNINVSMSHYVSGSPIDFCMEMAMTHSDSFLESASAIEVPIPEPTPTPTATQTGTPQPTPSSTPVSSPTPTPTATPSS